MARSRRRVPGPMTTNPAARRAGLRRATEFLRPARGAIVPMQTRRERRLLERWVHIAHRLSTVVDADRIVVLKQGRIVEEEKHAELVASRGYYASLVEKQTRGLFPLAA